MGELTAIPRGYVVVDADGNVEGVYDILPARYADLPVEDFGDKLLIPAFVDLHLHASQPVIQGLGHDPGADWFGAFCHPAEKRYNDLVYADALNRDLIRGLWEQGTMHANIMCTANLASTKNLFEQYEETGMAAAIGKMNADYAAFGGEPLEETETSIRETVEYVDWATGRSKQVIPALAPEFAPAMTGELMGALGAFAKERGLIINSHMCEGDFDNEAVAARFPEERLYGKVYDKYGLFGQTPTAMAHCLTCEEEEIALMAEGGVFMAHCPIAALNGAPETVMPRVRKFIEAGVPVGLASDIGGAHTLSIPQNMVAAIQISKRIPGYEPLSLTESFYLATKGGGALFGQVGSFEPGFQFDALVIDDARWNRHVEFSLHERLTRYIYCGDSRDIVHRYAAGKRIVL
ncbi:MAG: amidohydrolase family protein [Oscillospiraceae bacterium]|nr:amidohydrolase family protein [Oscillospiraceae bacterium]